MSLFKRKPRTEARAALKDPVFATTVSGVDHVTIDYDPAVWLRCPNRGVDRTSWVEESRAAYAEDLRLASESDVRTWLKAALDAIADLNLDDTPTLVGFGPKVTNQLTTTISVFDDELMMLEHGTPEAFLTFANDLSRPPATPRTFAGVGVLRRAMDSGTFCSLFHQVKVHLTDGRIL